MADATLIPYQKPQPHDMRPDMVIPDAIGHSDPRLWVPLSEHVAVRPLQFNVTLGQYTQVMRVTKAGMIAHATATQALYTRGYSRAAGIILSDWVAEEG